MLTIDECQNEKWVKKVITEDNSPDFITECYDIFLNKFSCKPDPDKFPKYKPNDIIDEDKSVKWNREEVIRRIAARDDEVKRLNQYKIHICNLYEEGLVKKLAKRHNLTIAKSKIIWEAAYRENHSNGVFATLGAYEDFAELYNKVLKA